MKMLFGERRHAAAIYSDEDAQAAGIHKTRRVGRNVTSCARLPRYGDDRPFRRKENGWKSHRLTRWR